MIKADKLQIGDWVQNHLGYKAQVLDIRYIKDNDDGYGGGYLIPIGESDWGSYQWLEEKDIESIPLTPEILEKNGWVKGDGYYCYRLCDAERLEYWLDDWRLERIWAGKGDKYLVTFRAFVSCVHTLQHALKLCGIDKEITL